MTDQAIEKAAHATSIQHAPPYITRQPLYITNPTLLSATQWREVAREPVTQLCLRHIVREMVALEWEITCEDDKEKSDDTIDYLTRILENADDGDGFDTWLARMLQDALMLPVAGNSETEPDDVTGMVGGIWHVDGATLYPTYDPDIPYVQINPYNGLDRVYFERGNLMRLVLHPRTELVKKMYQVAPLESAYPHIMQLASMYTYNMRQLSDTPVAGVLDLMDMTEGEAIDWAKGFRETFEGIDPLKIPILYDHVKPAKFISFGRSPSDLNIVEQYKRAAEAVASAFGLSIGDLRLFEHERVLAGVEASQRVTARQGIGFYAQAIEDMINRHLLMSSTSKFKFRFILGMTGEDQAKAQLAQTRSQILATLTGNQPVLKPNDAQKQAEAWGIVDVELTGVPTAPGLEGLGGMLPEDSLGSIDENADAIDELSTEESAPGSLDQLDQVAGDMEQFKALTSGQKKETDTVERFVRLLTNAFQQVGEDMNDSETDVIAEVIDEFKTRFPDYGQVQKATPAAEALDAILKAVDWYKLPNIIGQLTSVLKTGYEEGSLKAINKLQAQGYAEGFVSTGDPGIDDFVVINTRVLELLEEHGAVLVQQVDDGTRYYLRQKILSGMREGLSPGEIAEDIQDDLMGLGAAEAAKLSDARIMSIVNTELNWADSRANFDQMVACGLTLKQWVTRGFGDICDVCTGNQALGFVEMDYEYKSVFGDETILHPPAHPNTCRCDMIADTNELKGFFDSDVGFWTGGNDVPLLEQTLAEETRRVIRENRRQKSLPAQEWGQPDAVGKRSRFATKGDAQLWLGQFSLAPVISDSDIDVKDSGHKFVGVIWGKDGDEYVEAALMPVGDVNWSEVKDRKASLFGAKGAGLREKSLSATNGIIAITVPDDLYKRLGGDLTSPHITLVSFQDVNDWALVQKAVSEAIANFSPFSVEMPGIVRQMGRYLVGAVTLTPKLVHLRDELVAALHRHGAVGTLARDDAYRPHVSLAKITDSNDTWTGVDASVPELAGQFQVTGVTTLRDDVPEFFGFVQKSNAIEQFSNLLPGQYKKEFADFVRRRSNRDIGTIDDVAMAGYYDDFMQTLLVGGFDYWRESSKPPLIRSIVKSSAGYDAPDAPGMVKAYLEQKPDVAAAIRWLTRKGYTIRAKAVYTGAGYSAVHDPANEELWMDQSTSSWNREGVEALKRQRQYVVDGLSVRVPVQTDVGGDPVTKLIDVAAFNTAQELENWTAKLKAKKDNNAYRIDPDTDMTWMR